MRYAVCRWGAGCGLLALLLAGPAQGQEPVTRLEDLVVTANREATAADQVGSSVTVITAEEMAQRQQRTVLDALRAVPALDVVQSGGPGGQASVAIRGAMPEQTLVLIDGVRANDPSTIGGGFDFATLTVDNIERIEVLRGPQSTLYGSDAMGGVIQIITRRGDGRPKGSLSLEGGSFTTLRSSGNLSGSTDLVNYSLGVSRLDTSGISAAGSSYGNRERDGFHTTSVSTRLGLTPTKQFAFDCSVRFQDERTELDQGGGAGQDDPNYVSRGQRLYLRSEARLALLEDRWRQTLGLSFTTVDRTYRDDTDPVRPLDLSRGTYYGQTLAFDWQHVIRLHRTNTLTLGMETREEVAESSYYSESMWGPYDSSFPKTSARTTGYYVQDRIAIGDAWFTTLGVRLDDHSRFGGKGTWRATTSYLIKQTATRLRGSYGTGFKAPSLYQLYEPTYGNRNLSPEKNRGWDAGVEQAFLDGLVEVGFTWFQNDFKDLIEFDSGTWSYRNIARAASRGAEVTATLRPTEEMTLRAGYTYTRTEDKSTGEELLRRPEHKVSLNGEYRFLGKGNAALGITYVGQRADRFFDPVSYSSQRVSLGGYLLVNLAASWQVNPWLRIHGRIDNLLNRDYEQVKGFGTPGIAGYAGVTVSM